MHFKSLLFLTVFALFNPGCAPGQPGNRPEWDQKKAIAIVEKVVALEKSGQPWDDIDWLVDPDVAIAQARHEDKPIFVFAFVRGTRGPAAAPC